jgi:5'-3' exonuclease
MNRRPPKNGEKREKKINMLLVDGNALFKRSILGAKDVYNHNQEHIGGLYQFITVLRKLIDDDLYHKVFVFWDGKLSGQLRFNIYSDYKSNRNKDYVNGTHPVDESELLQKIQIKRYLEELFIRQYEDKIVESDDLIAYICNNKKSNEKITICTSDRDLCQLIGEDVRIYMCDLKQYITLDNYNQFFKHHLTNAALIKIFCGDNSDCIKGVKRLGEDTLLKHFPEIREGPVNISDIIIKASELQLERINNKQKPLQILDNIAMGITDGVQGDKLYEINEKLVNLKKPMITENVIRDLEMVMELPIDPEGRDVKNAYQLMKEDGLDREIHNHITEYLLPFKRLIEREKNNNLINE